MNATSILDERFITGVVLILAFVSFAIGGILPTVGAKGNFRIFTLPAREHLLAVAENAVAWRKANVFMGAAAVILLTGLTMLTSILERANERMFSLVGLVGFLLATVLWVIFSAFRGVVTIEAAQELTTTGAMPTYYEPLAKFGFALFYVYAVVGYLALAAFGLSLLQAGILPSWVAWATTVVSLALLVLLFITGDTLPAFHYLPPLLIGILLIVQR